MAQRFYSNGKLLITGEYVVLDGAKAFALPTKFGQDLVVENASGKTIHWRSIDADGSVWFEENITFAEIVDNALSNDSHSVKNTLMEILHQAFLLQPQFIETSDGYFVSTQLTFPKFWGLGTSSTLINNLAQWLDIDPYTLLQNSFGGSGYDIACAQYSHPITYQLLAGNPVVSKVKFHPDFVDSLYFVYLNKKQSSKDAIASYRLKKQQAVDMIPQINALTDAIVSAPTLFDFRTALEEHEQLLSAILEHLPVKETLFHDFNGTIKSLGAWGGDFVLAVAEENPTAYFQSKGFAVVVPYSDIIIK